MEDTENQVHGHTEKSCRTEEEPVDHVEIDPEMTVGTMIDEMSGAGFGAGDLAEAVDVYARILESDCTRFLSLAGAMVPAGMKEVVIKLIEEGHVDVVVTTGANMVHDMVEALGGKHYHGNPEADDVELHEEGIDRIYDVYLHEGMFSELESHVQSLLGDREEVSIREFTRLLGDSVDEGWLHAAAEKGVDVYCPAVQDSVLGLQAWLQTQNAEFRMDALSDIDDLTETCFKSESSGALIVGGGVPKNYTLQTMLVSPTTFDYAVQLTMDRPQTGGLSGATLDEARSWGKIGEDGKAVTVYGDATITLPLLVSGALYKIGQ
ncbi:MAG: deoxyhypusine synthase [Halobacteria archaeon]